MPAALIILHVNHYVARVSKAMEDRPIHRAKHPRKVFCFFFSKKKCFLIVSWPVNLGAPRSTGAPLFFEEIINRMKD
jgi:hypothetical protein